LISKLKGSSAPAIVLRAEEKVPIDQVVYVMNIANQNSIKIVLAVDAP
jgi:biopolymer transport protein ExbD